MRTATPISALAKRVKDALAFPGESSSTSVEALIELDRRAAFGGFVYMACWGGIAYSSDIAISHSTKFFAVSACLLLIFVLRVVLHVFFARLARWNEVVARLCFLFLVLGAGLVLGLAAMNSMLDPQLEQMKYPMILVCGVLCTAATLILSIDPVLRYGIPTVMLLPISIGVMMGGTGVDFTLAVLLLVNVVYLVSVSGYTHHDYWAGAKSRLHLQRQSEKFESLSLTDSLTGLPNRLSLEKKLVDVWDAMTISQQPLSIMMIDIDHFKSINDTYGHPFGDECLKAVAGVFRQVAQRAGDFIARYGGEEFLVVVPVSQAKDVEAMAERLRQAVAAIQLQSGGKVIAFTCSIGVATALPCKTNDALQLTVERADKALYAAKQSGRNKVVMSSAMEGDA